MTFDDDTVAKAAEVIESQQWPATVKLRYPVEFGDETISELKFRRGRFGDLRGVKSDGFPSDDQIMMVASRMSGRPTKVLEMLDMDDISEVKVIVMGFFAKSLGAGKTG